MDEAQFKARTKQFALRAMRLSDALPKSRSADVIARQFLRAATSVGANYRAACRAVSRADMISKLGDVEEEADECVYWLELIADGELLPRAQVGPITKEAGEILAMVVASIITMRRRGSKVPIQNPKSKI